MTTIIPDVEGEGSASVSVSSSHVEVYAQQLGQGAWLDFTPEQARDLARALFLAASIAEADK